MQTAAINNRCSGVLGNHCDCAYTVIIICCLHHYSLSNVRDTTYLFLTQALPSFSKLQMRLLLLLNMDWMNEYWDMSKWVWIIGHDLSQTTRYSFQGCQRCVSAP